MLSLAALVLALVAASLTGSTRLSAGDVTGAVSRLLAREPAAPLDVILFGIRLPRVALAGLVGASLGLAGAIYQGVFRNPLADPFLLGTASGAGLGTALSATLAGATLGGVTLAHAVPATVAGALLALGRWSQPLVAFVFALATVLAVMLLARSGRSFPVVRLILAGVVLSSMLSAATSFVMVASREQAAGILARLLGGFGYAGWQDVLVVGACLAVAAVVTLTLARTLDALQLGDRGAAHLGVPVETVRVATLGAATLATAAAVSVSGIIGFVGLMTPHAVRLVVGPRHAVLLPLSLVWGCTFMICADLLGRTLIAPAEVPVGIVTAIVGGPLFLLLLRRTRGAW